jgi:hypothetical protein
VHPADSRAVELHGAIPVHRIADDARHECALEHDEVRLELAAMAHVANLRHGDTGRLVAKASVYASKLFVAFGLSLVLFDASAHAGCAVPATFVRPE